MTLAVIPLMALFYPVLVNYTLKKNHGNFLGGGYFLNKLKDDFPSCVSLMGCAGLNA